MLKISLQLSYPARDVESLLIYLFLSPAVPLPSIKLHILLIHSLSSLSSPSLAVLLALPLTEPSPSSSLVPNPEPLYSTRQEVSSIFFKQSYTARKL